LWHGGPEEVQPLQDMAAQDGDRCDAPQLDEVTQRYLKTKRLVDASSG
jgi:hypothetical protein